MCGFGGIGGSMMMIVFLLAIFLLFFARGRFCGGGGYERFGDGALADEVTKLRREIELLKKERGGQ